MPGTSALPPASNNDLQCQSNLTNVFALGVAEHAHYETETTIGRQLQLRPIAYSKNFAIAS